MTKVINQTHYVYGGLDQDGCSVNMFETAEDAKAACIESMKKAEAAGWNVLARAIIRVDRTKIYNDSMVISEQITKTTIEVISKSDNE